MHLKQVRSLYFFLMTYDCTRVNGYDIFNIIDFHMQISRKKQNADDPLNITAMIDVVFLLLIFFICTASLNLPESEIKTALPAGSTKVPEFQPVKISLSKADGGLLVSCDNTLCLTDSVLRESIISRSQLADIPVIFSITDEVSFDELVHTIDICRQGGLKKIAIPIVK